MVAYRASRVRENQRNLSSIDVILPIFGDGLAGKPEAWDSACTEEWCTEPLAAIGRAMIRLRSSTKVAMADCSY